MGLPSAPVPTRRPRTRPESPRRHPAGAELHGTLSLQIVVEREREREGGGEEEYLERRGEEHSLVQDELRVENGHRPQRRALPRPPWRFPFQAAGASLRPARYTSTIVKSPMRELRDPRREKPDAEKLEDDDEKQPDRAD